MTWHHAARVHDLQPGELTRFWAGKHQYLLARLDETRWAATDLSCTHAYSELDMGILIGTQLSCISHGAIFELTNGTVISPSMTGGKTPRLRTFPTRTQGDDVLVDIADNDNPPHPAE